MPEHLYKYEKLSTLTLRNLKAQSIYFGPPINFNDPYDCAFTPNFIHPTHDKLGKVREKYISSQETSPKAVRELKSMGDNDLAEMLISNARLLLEKATQEFLGSRGVTCFSEVPDDLLMWAHYGGNYKGFCLEFDADVEPFRNAKQVQYVECPPPLDPSRILLDQDWDAAEFLFCTKSQAWAYEREWRAIHQNARTSFVYPAESLKGVYFGPDVHEQELEIVCLILQGQNQSVRLWRGSRSASEFSVHFTEFTYTSFASAKAAGQQ